MKQPHTVTVARMAATASGHAWSNVDTDAPCFIQPLSSFRAAQLGVAYGQSYRMFVSDDTKTWRPGDKLTDQDGATYKIKDKVPRNFGTSRTRHIEFIIVRDTEA